MPKKIPEKQREAVVALRKSGATYTAIEKDPSTVNPETGNPISRPTLIKILKEAGLTKSASAAAPTVPSVSGSMPSTDQSSVVPASSDGVSDFMPAKPPASKQKVVSQGPIEFQCDQCGAEFIADSEADLPEACPECGQ